MKKNLNLNLINSFLDAIFPLPECFGLICKEDEGDELEYQYDINQAIKKIDPNASLEFGMSKMVIISPKMKNFVIKIPFNGYYSETYYLDGDNDELEWVSFYQAPTEDGSDYCYAEYEKFKSLKNKGLNCFIAKTLFYKEIDGIRVFLQEKVTPSFFTGGGSPSKMSTNLALKWKKERKYFLSIDAAWVAACIDYYGKKKTEKFLNYCSNEDEDILSDCHNGNYGYRDDGSPALLDFSGFFG